MRFVFGNLFLLVFGIRFGKTKQVIITFVATTIKALLAVAKTSDRLSGCKLYTGYIHHGFWIFTHIILPLT